ncbi:MAG: ribosome maturation factor RimM [Muribaculaceae bacterium]|nr:ribosome maturation factor RimM [Muribaculaceae bacterium]
MILSSDIIEIGTFTKTHGIKGELNALLDDGTEIMQHVSCIILEIDSIFVPHFITSCRSKGASASLIMIDGINSEIEAKDLVSKSIYVLKEEYNTFHDIDEDENGEGGYASDFIGYSIVDEDDNEIGEIIDIDDSTDNPLFIVDNNGNTVYIPITEEFILFIDDDKEVIGMSLPEGLIELNIK